MTSDELTKQLEQLGLSYTLWFERCIVHDHRKSVLFMLPANATPKDIELKLREYKKEIKKREIKTTKESMQGELL